MDDPVFVVHLSSFVLPCHIMCNVDAALTTSYLHASILQALPLLLDLKTPEHISNTILSLPNCC